MRGILLECPPEDAALLIASHEIRDLETLLDRVIILDQGKAVLDEPAEDLRARRGQSIEEIFTEVCER